MSEIERRSAEAEEIRIAMQEEEELQQDLWDDGYYDKDE